VAGIAKVDVGIRLLAEIIVIGNGVPGDAALVTVIANAVQEVEHLTHLGQGSFRE
jgi:hypothetical protein